MKKVFAAGLLLLCTLLIGVIFFSAVGNKYINKTNLGVFGLPRLLTICTEMSLKDKQTAEKIIETARTVFEYTGSYDNSNKNVGALSAYYEYDCVSAVANIELITAKTFGNHGYIWLEYSESHTRINDKGKEELSAGCNNTLSFWKIKRVSDNWVVVKITEAP